MAQVVKQDGQWVEEPPIVTLGNHVDAVRRLSRSEQSPYWARDVIADLPGEG